MAYTLSQIEQALRDSWGADTTCLDTKSLMRWHQGNPAHGQCGPTALVVQDLLGGELLIAAEGKGSVGAQARVCPAFRTHLPAPGYAVLHVSNSDHRHVRGGKDNCAA